MADKTQLSRSREGYFFGVSPLMLFPQTRSEFAVYLKQDEAFVLYTREQEVFTDHTRQRLFDSGVEEVYVLQEQKAAYERYVERNLGRILDNQKLPLAERAKVFYGVSVDILKEAFETRLPDNISHKLYERISSFAKEGIKFLGQKGGLKSVAQLISHDYYTYTHCVQVFVYSCSVLQTFGYAGDDLVKVGVGALLHDIGKTKIPLRILNKPGKLNREEWETIQTHPVQGAAMCAGLPIGQEVLNCVLFHHERIDGKGYPAAMGGAQITLPVKAISVADAYDALISDRPYAAGIGPFDALTLMREKMHGAFDMEVYRRLVLILSGADIV